MMSTNSGQTQMSRAIETKAQEARRYAQEQQAGAKEPDQREIDSLKDTIRDLASLIGNNTARIEQLANRLGHYPPKADQCDSVPCAPCGHLDEIASMIRGIGAAANEATDYLRAIERRI